MPESSLVHFVLFVIACYETNVRNRQTQIIYTPGPPYEMVMQPNMEAPMMVPRNYHNYQVPAGYMPQVYYPPQTQYYKSQDHTTVR